MSASNIRTLMNMFRTGIVDAIDPAAGTVRVVFPDKDDSISEDLPLIASEYNMPEVGQTVFCLFLPNGVQEGICLGSFYSEENRPPTSNPDLYVKKLDEGLSIEYNKKSKSLRIQAASPITISAPTVSVNGNLNVSGNITAGGTISGA
ncbi:phage baseplate assembly protein V [Bacillus infantis]|uniref:Phage baseplate assembly protein V n=1 Tax=Bacillus infantis TaxID=324767 RepID=A0A5D4SWX9_9BACI|nr:phage baseplate assembly protein V [Bacillus infantis]TYS66376.1 phage baseplate assembly protein V [Bacillus infantis]